MCEMEMEVLQGKDLKHPMNKRSEICVLKSKTVLFHLISAYRQMSSYVGQGLFGSRRELKVDIVNLLRVVLDNYPHLCTHSFYVTF